MSTGTLELAILAVVYNDFSNNKPLFTINAMHSNVATEVTINNS